MISDSVLLFAFVKRVFGVAVAATQIAESEPNENTRPPCPAAFALDGMIDLVNGQRRFAHIETV